MQVFLLYSLRLLRRFKAKKIGRRGILLCLTFLFSIFGFLFLTLCYVLLDSVCLFSLHYFAVCFSVSFQGWTGFFSSGFVLRAVFKVPCKYFDSEQSCLKGFCNEIRALLPDISRMPHSYQGIGSQLAVFSPKLSKSEQLRRRCVIFDRLFLPWEILISVFDYEDKKCLFVLFCSVFVFQNLFFQFKIFNFLFRI